MYSDICNNNYIIDSPLILNLKNLSMGMQRMYNRNKSESKQEPQHNGPDS